jgi:hypothetical protein
MQDINQIIDKYLKPFLPKDTKPKTPQQQKKSDELKAQAHKLIQSMLSDDFIKDIIKITTSKEEAQTKIKQFLSK